MAEMLSPFGNQIPFCEPSWYQGQFSPYYTASHVEYRAKCRKFVEEEIKPNLEKWIKTGYPKTLHERAYQLGITSVLYPAKFGGLKEAGGSVDSFHELIYVDELVHCLVLQVGKDAISFSQSRCGGGYVMGQVAIDSMALPPIFHFGSEYIKNKVLSFHLRNVFFYLKNHTIGLPRCYHR